MRLYSVSESYLLIYVQQKAKHRVSKHATSESLCNVSIGRQSYVSILSKNFLCEFTLSRYQLSDAKSTFIV